jgi:hypothetical protein
MRLPAVLPRRLLGINMNRLRRRPGRSFARALALVSVPGLLLLSGFGCNTVTDPSKNTVETFTGTLSVQGVGVHNFTAQKNGEYSITVKSLAPVSNLAVGVAFGAANSDGTCSLINYYAPVTVGYGLAGAITPGKYCAVIYDIGALAADETYTLEVSHP